MDTANNVPPNSLGLGGDGDEIAAIAAVERRFGVQLDYTGSPHWKTVGDVFAALQRELSAEQAEPGEIWTAFTEAISGETAVDPTRVTADTLLLGKSHFDWRLAFVVACVMVLAFVLDRFG